MRRQAGHSPATMRMSALQALVRRPVLARSPCICAQSRSVHMQSHQGEMRCTARHSHSDSSSSAAGTMDATASCKQPTPAPATDAAWRPSQHARAPLRPPRRSRPPTVSLPSRASPATTPSCMTAARSALMPPAAGAAAVQPARASSSCAPQPQFSVGRPMARPAITHPRPQRRPPTASVTPSTAACRPAMPSLHSPAEQPQAARPHLGQLTASPANRCGPRRPRMRLSESAASHAAPSCRDSNGRADGGQACATIGAANMWEMDGVVDAASCSEQHGGMYRSMAVVAVADFSCQISDDEWRTVQASQAASQCDESNSIDSHSATKDSSRHSGRGGSSNSSSSRSSTHSSGSRGVIFAASSPSTASTSAATTTLAPAAFKVCPPRGRPRLPRRSASMPPQPDSIPTQHLQQQQQQQQQQQRRQRQSRLPLAPTNEAWEVETEAALLALQSVGSQLEQLELHHIGPADAVGLGVQVMLVSVHQPGGPGSEAHLYITQDRTVRGTAATAAADRELDCSNTEDDSSNSSSSSSSSSSRSSRSSSGSSAASSSERLRHLPEQQGQLQERQPFILAPGLSFAPTADASCGDWYVYVIAVAGDFSPEDSEGQNMFPNAVRHVGSMRLSHNMRNAQDLAGFLAEAKEEAVKGHALNVVKRAVFRDVYLSPDWCMDRLADCWGAAPLEAFGVTRSYVNSLGVQELARYR